MKEIKLDKFGSNRGKYVALVDDEDYEYLNQFSWHCIFKKYATYAVSCINGKIIKMHRFIMNTPTGLVVDHMDHNGLNNQKSNLRNCTQTENKRNRKPGGDINYLGVSLHKNKYMAGPIDNRELKCATSYKVGITSNGKQICVGYFKTPEEAALVYNDLAIENHGRFANLNLKHLYTDEFLKALKESGNVNGIKKFKDKC